MTSGQQVTFLAHEPCVDALLYRKTDMIPEIASRCGLSLDEFVSATGLHDDGDLSLLGWDRSRDHPLVSAPANAKTGVKTFVQAARNGFVAQEEDFDGSVAAANEAWFRGARLFLSDVDGCWRRGKDVYGDRFQAEFLPRVGYSAPVPIFITGSSYVQNHPFFTHGYGLNTITPGQTGGFEYFIAIENGGILVDPRTGKKTNLAYERNPAVFRVLKGDFQRAIEGRVTDEVAPAFGFGVTDNEHDKTSNVYFSGRFKENFPTTDCPRDVRDPKDATEAKNWRLSDAAKRFRGSVLRVYCEEAERLDMPFAIDPVSRDWVDKDALGPYTRLLG